MRPAPTPIELHYSYGEPTVVPNVEQNTADWMSLRGTCDLTASEIASVIGVGYDSPKTLWKKKCGLMVSSGEQPNHYQQEAMKRGQFLEPYARARMDAALYRRSYDGGFWKRKVTFRGLEFMLGASPDALYPPEPANPKPRVLEIKCPTSKMDCAPDSEDSRDRFWTYWFQIQCQLFCTGFDKAYLLLFHPDLPNLAYQIHFDVDMWTNYVLPRLAEFIQNVHARVEPGRVPKVVRQELRIVWAEKLMVRKKILHFPLPSLQNTPRPPKRTATEMQDGGIEDDTLEVVGHAFEQSQAKRTSPPSPPDLLSPADRDAADSAKRPECEAC